MSKILSLSTENISTPSQHLTVSTINGDNKENTTLIWFDPNIGSCEDIKITMNRLREISDYTVFHTELEFCVTLIKSIQNEKVFLITSGKRASELLPHIVNLRQIDSIFIYCIKSSKYEHLMKTYSKIVGIYVDIESLCASIREQVDLVDKQLETFSFFDQHQKSTKDLSKESAAFLWFQLFSHVILSLPHDQQAKCQMLNFCRQYYRGNNTQQKVIDAFEQNYQPELAIQWYSKQSFIYKLVNKALRSEDIDQLHTFRFFIGDLSHSLKREHQKIVRSGEKNLTLYRGLKLSNEELNKLKENQGKLISTNGFLSTSRCRSLAVAFATKHTTRTDALPILFQIEYNVKKQDDSVICADIAEFSDYPKEEEVLFDFNAVFQIENIQRDAQLWIINMSASRDGQTITHDYIDLMRRETEEKTVPIMFGRLMCEMGQYDKSFKYFEQLLLHPNGEDLASIEFNMGRTLHYKGEQKLALKYYDSAYNRMINVDPPRIKDSASVLNNIGIVLQQRKKYEEALDFHQRALKIRKKYFPVEHSDIALSLKNIGSVLKQQGKHSEALDYCKQALKIQEQYYPRSHPAIASSLIIIGNVYRSQEKFDEALELYQRALKMLQECYPTDHPDIAWSLSSIGSIFQNRQEYQKALDMYQQALTMKEKYYPTDHVSIAWSCNDIGSILQAQGKYDEALNYHQRALQIREKHYPATHVNIATSLRNIGESYENLNNSKLALNFYKKALVIYKKSLPVDDPVRKKTEETIGRLSSLE